MKVSTVKVLLTEKDILDIIDEFVEVPGLVINKIEIKELITVHGSYKKGVAVPFKANVGIGSIHGNIVNIKIMNVNVAKLGILKVIKNFALKNFLSDFSENGIKVDKDTIIVDLDTIIKVVPGVDFKLKSLEITNNGLQAEVEDFAYVPNKEVESFGKIKEKNKFVRVDDNYSKIRKNIDEKVPDKYSNLIEYAMIVPDIVALFWRLFRDKRVSIKVKILIGGIIAYLASPVDILPDFIPFIGQIDDVAIAFFGLHKVIEEVPNEIILQNWQGKEDIILKVKEVISYLYKVLGGENVAKLLGYLKKLSKRTEEKKDDSQDEECVIESEITNK